ncbi:unnamed protein product, partial [Mesorhabditis belari]|uniref:Major facilitator superfamily (MFS) profile domain-containing protein n=1 Tax=Mesorhabditis belari TaxID=2138241 RepID=A0AAF3EQ52_9BILA
MSDQMKFQSQNDPSSQPLFGEIRKTSGEKKEQTLDDYVHLSRYCFRVLVFSEFVLLSVMGNMVYMVYAGAEPRKVQCLDDNLAIFDEDVCNGNFSQNYDLLQANCSFYFESEFESVNINFGYFCEKTDYVKLSISFQMAGVLFGALLFGHMSDKHGRKKILMYCYVLCAGFQVLASFARTLMAFTMLRMLVGFFNGGQMTIFTVYKIEHIPKRHRLWISALISFAPNFIIMNGLAYISKDWVTFQRVLVLVSLPAFFISFFLNESPRWLLGRGRIGEAEKVLLEIQRIDGKTQHKEGLTRLLQIEFQKAEARERKAKNYSIRHLFYTANMAKATITLALGMVITSMINYGLMFNLEKLAGSIYWNSSLLGLLRWILNSTLGFLDYRFQKCGRKPFHFIAQFGSFLCLTVVAVGHLTGKSDEWSQFIRIATIVATAVCSQVYLSKGITSMEYFPSVVRNMGISFNSTWSRFGSILAPLMFRMHQSKALPFIFMAIISLIDAAGFQLNLPETKGKPMQDTLPEKANKRNEILVQKIENANELNVE